MNFSIHFSHSGARPLSFHFAGSRDAVVDLPERSVRVLDHQTMAAPTNALAVEEKPGSVAVLALVDTAARVLRVSIARHADRAEVEPMALRLPRFCRLAELGAQAIRRR